MPTDAVAPAAGGTPGDEQGARADKRTRGLAVAGGSASLYAKSKMPDDQSGRSIVRRRVGGGGQWAEHSETDAVSTGVPVPAGR